MRMWDERLGGEFTFNGVDVMLWFEGPDVLMFTCLIGSVMKGNES